MILKTRCWLAAFAVASLVAGWASPAFALPSDDVIPGVTLPPSIVSGDLDQATDPRDVYSVSLIAGETLVLSLTTDTAAASLYCDLDIYLYGPGVAPGTPVHSAAVARAALPTFYPETITYAAPVSGTYYIELYAAEGAGPTRLTWSIVPEPLLPVFRFYNVRTGTHFYTASTTEAAIVRQTWPTVFADEGIAYHTKASKNPEPLYRFYNVRTGSHFYTASPEEKAIVLATWPNVFAYEGETYRVSRYNDGTKTAVYRFLNVRNGSHFYTASAHEADLVRQHWPTVYRDEGVAFYVGQ